MSETTPKPASAVPTSDELLRLVVESATDYAIFSMDADGIATSWNTGAERLLGYSEAEMVGHSADLIFTPEDRAAGAAEEERRQALAQGRAEDERWQLRKGGARFWASGLLMPLADARAGFVKILRDRTERHRAEEQLRESEERFRVLATNIPQLVFRSKSTGDRDWGSPQWEIFTGLSFDESLGFGWLDAVHPKDREATLAAWPAAAETGEYYVEHRIRRWADGEYRWHQTRAKPLQNSDVAASEWVGTSSDIHELRGLQDRQKVLLAELQHRTRNLLGLVQSIARQMLRTSGTLADFGAEFGSRLRALGRAQGLLARADQEGLELRDLVAAELAPHGDGGSAVRIEGPPVVVPPESVQTLALALHELATNAVKYGALAQPAGKLAVTWRVEPEGARPHVVLDWRESGVPMPAGPPERIGYGRELIERALPYELKAKTHFEFAAEGVHCSIAVPIAASERGAAHA